MPMNPKIKSIVRDVKYMVQQTRGRAKQTAGRATGDDRLRREGKAEETQGQVQPVRKEDQGRHPSLTRTVTYSTRGC